MPRPLSTVGAIGTHAFNAGGIYGTLHLVDQPFYESLSRANKSLAISAMAMESYFNRSHMSLQQLTHTLTAIGGIAAVGIGAATFMYAKFEKQMRDVNSISKLSEASLNGLSKQVLKLTTDIREFSPEELGKGLYQIASSGFYGADGLKVLTESAKTAVAGVSGLEQTATATVGILQAYGLAATDATKVSDILFNTVNFGIIRMEELTQGIGQVSAVASLAKIPLEDVSGAIIAMTRAGFMPANALVRVERFIAAFTKTPSKELKELIGALGYGSGTELLQKEGLLETVQKIYDITKDKPALIGELFGEQREYQAIAVLLKDDAKKFREAMDLARKYQGTRDSAYVEQRKALMSQANALKQEFIVSVSLLGEKAAPAVVEILKGLKPVVESIKDINIGLAITVTKWALIGAGVAGVARILSDVGRSVYGGITGTLERMNTGRLVSAGAMRPSTIGEAARLASIKTSELLVERQMLATQIEENKQTNAAIREAEKLLSTKRYMMPLYEREIQQAKANLTILQQQNQEVIRGAAARIRELQQSKGSINTKSYDSRLASLAGRRQALVNEAEGTPYERIPRLKLAIAEIDAAMKKIDADRDRAIAKRLSLINQEIREQQKLITQAKGLTEEEKKRISMMELALFTEKQILEEERQRLANSKATNETLKQQRIQQLASIDSQVGLLAAELDTERKIVLMIEKEIVARKELGLEISKQNAALNGHLARIQKLEKDIDERARKITTEIPTRMQQNWGKVKGALASVGIDATTIIFAGALALSKLFMDVLGHIKRMKSAVSGLSEELGRQAEKTRESASAQRELIREYEDLKNKKILNAEESLRLETLELRVRDAVYASTKQMSAYTGSIESNTEALRNNILMLERKARYLETAKTVERLGEEQSKFEYMSLRYSGKSPQDLEGLGKERPEYEAAFKADAENKVRQAAKVAKLSEQDTVAAVNYFRSSLAAGRPVSVAIESLTTSLGGGLNSGQSILSSASFTAALRSTFAGRSSFYSDLAKKQGEGIAAATGASGNTFENQVNRAIGPKISALGSYSGEEFRKRKAQLLTRLQEYKSDKYLMANGHDSEAKKHKARVFINGLIQQVNGMTTGTVKPTPKYDSSGTDKDKHKGFEDDLGVLEANFGTASNLRDKAIEDGRLDVAEKLQLGVNKSADAYIAKLKAAGGEYKDKDEQSKVAEALEKATTVDKKPWSVVEAKFEQKKRDFDNAVSKKDFATASTLAGGLRGFIEIWLPKVGRGSSLGQKLESAYTDIGQWMKEPHVATQAIIDSIQTARETARQQEIEVNRRELQENGSPLDLLRFEQGQTKDAESYLEGLTTEFNSNSSTLSGVAGFDKVKGILLKKPFDITDAELTFVKSWMNSHANDLSKVQVDFTAWLNKMNDGRKKLIDSIDNERSVGKEGIGRLKSQYDSGETSAIDSIVSLETLQKQMLAGKYSAVELEKVNKTIADIRAKEWNAEETAAEKKAKDYEEAVKLRVQENKYLVDNRELTIEQFKLTLEQELAGVDYASDLVEKDKLRLYLLKEILKVKEQEVEQTLNLKTLEYQLDDIYLDKQMIGKDASYDYKRRYALEKLLRAGEVYKLRKSKAGLTKEENGQIDAEYLTAETSYLKEINQLKTEQLKPFGELLWDARRDAGVFGDYLKTLLESSGKKHFEKFWKETLTGQNAVGQSTKTLWESPKFADLRAKFSKGGKFEKAGKYLQGAGDVYGAYTNIASMQTESGTDGAIQGGLSVGAGLGGLMDLGLLPVNPALIIAGVVLGGIMGLSKATKNAHERAQKIREAQLAELKQMNNKLQPVADFFNRGGFGSLTSAFNFGQGMSLEYAWAIEDRRGIR
jgi:TP901 family phage tail tape measure protein